MLVSSLINMHELVSRKHHTYESINT